MRQDRIKIDGTGKIVNWYNKKRRKKGEQKKIWNDEIINFISDGLYHRVAWDRRKRSRLREAFAQY